MKREKHSLLFFSLWFLVEDFREPGKPDANEMDYKEMEVSLNIMPKGNGS